MYNILLIDDEVHTLKGMETSLRQLACPVGDIYSAINLKLAKEILEQKKVHIVICDIELPRGNGLELISWINNKEIQVVSILLTCHEEFDYARKAIQLGVMEYLLKPVSLAHLEKVIEKAIDRIKDTKELARTDQSEVKESSSFVESLKAYIEEHISEETIRDQMAEHFHFSPDYISRRFKQETGETLSEFIFNKKMETAKNLLVNTDMPVSDIVTFIGYSNFSHFSKIFKKSAGLTPLKYRQEKHG